MISVSPYRYKQMVGLGSAFLPAYNIVRANEGGYVNNPADPGKETYAGISRRYWPNWVGWAIIDQVKSRAANIVNDNSAGNPFSNIGSLISGWIGFNGMGIATNEIIPELDHLVYDFYLSLWAKSKAGQIIDQQVANNYFDFYVLSSRAVEVLQRALISIGIPVTADNIIGTQTLNAANSANPEKLNSALVTERRKWHNQMVASGRAPAVFLDNWESRAAKFGSELKENTLWIIGGLSLVGLAYFVYKNTRGHAN